MNRAIIASLCLAGAAVSTVNVMTYLHLQNETPKPTSRHIAEIEQKEATALSLDRKDDTIAWEQINPLLAQVFCPPSTPQSAPLQRPPASAQVSKSRHVEQLPALAGILRRADSDGVLHHSAILSGRILETGDRVDGYTVEKIDDTGVTLARRGRKLFVAAPKIDYSAWNTQ